MSDPWVNNYPWVNKLPHLIQHTRVNGACSHLTGVHNLPSWVNLVTPKVQHVLQQGQHSRVNGTASTPPESTTYLPRSTFSGHWGNQHSRVSRATCYPLVQHVTSCVNIVWHMGQQVTPPEST